MYVCHWHVREYLLYTWGIFIKWEDQRFKHRDINIQELNVRGGSYKKISNGEKLEGVVSNVTEKSSMEVTEQCPWDLPY